MSSKHTKKTYDELAEAYNRLIDHKPHNAYYDRPNTLSLLGEVNGISILDAACGPGKYAEILLEKGAELTGFDLSTEMIRFAQQRNTTKGHFFVQDLGQPFSTLQDCSFDQVLCALALHYLEDWRPTVREFHRVLKDNGEVVISIEHPFFEYQYYQSDDYFKLESVQCTWRGFGKPVQMHSYRRSLNDCLLPFTSNGFYVDTVLEPKPVPEFEKLDPKHFKELNEFPAFMCIKYVKK